MSRSASTEPLPFQEAAARVRASTVKVWTQKGAGTAFYIGQGQFVTAGHVVDGEAFVRLTNAVHDYDEMARVVGYLPPEGGDLAILGAMPAPLARYSASPALIPLRWVGEMSAGEEVGLAGYPGGFGNADFWQPAAVTRGVVSRLYKKGGIDYIQTDAAINPGNSGGPLFDLYGRVAGVVSRKFASIGGLPAEGVGFAVAEPTLSELLQHIRQTAAVSLSCAVSQAVVKTEGAVNVHCTVTDAGGWPVVGAEVTLDMSEGEGWIAGSSQVLTDERGQAVFTYLAPPSEGQVVFQSKAGQGRASVELMVRALSRISAISSDAPARVAPLSETTVNVTVMDDEGVRVGAVPISVEKLEGDGSVDGPGGMTSDGRASFSFLAPLGVGPVSLLVRAGVQSEDQQVQDLITVYVGPEPELPHPNAWSAPLAPGTSNLIWNGENGVSPSVGCGEGVVSIWQWNGDGWDTYFPDASGVPGGNTLKSLNRGEAYWVVVE